MSLDELEYRFKRREPKGGLRAVIEHAACESKGNVMSHENTYLKEPPRIEMQVTDGEET